MIKKVFYSNYFTVFLLILGLLFLAVASPSAYHPYSKYQTAISIIICFYSSLTLFFFHFFWIREKSIMLMHKFSLVVVKSFGANAILVGIFLSYQFFLGSMFDESKALRKMFLIEPKLVLATYYNKQMDEFKKTKMFLLDTQVDDGNRNFDLLINKTNFSKTRRFKYGTAKDDPFILKHCPDCLVSKTSFKVAAYGQLNEEEFFITVDDKAKAFDRIEFKFVLGRENK